MANPEHIAKLKEGVEAWNRWRDENPEIAPDLSTIDFNVEFEHLKVVTIWNRTGRLDLGSTPRWFKHYTLKGVNFSRTNLWRSNLDRVRLQRADLRKANLSFTYLTDAVLWGVNLRRANLEHSDLNGAYLAEVIYIRSELAGRCMGIRGVEATSGNAVLRRDLLDQDLIDTQRSRWKQPWWNPARVFFLWPWSWFDYGRGWVRVVLFATLLIGIFGACYSASSGTHIHFTHDGPTVKGLFYPWFVACMGFATLGISDLVEPLDGIGQALVIGNVISGFVTLGLLMSVLGNSFARRA